MNDMVIEQVEITQTAGGELEVTLRGDGAKIINILAHGLPREGLVQLQEALNAELKARGLV